MFLLFPLLEVLTGASKKEYQSQVGPTPAASCGVGYDDGAFCHRLNTCTTRIGGGKAMAVLILGIIKRPQPPSVFIICIYIYIFFNILVRNFRKAVPLANWVTELVGPSVQ